MKLMIRYLKPFKWAMLLGLIIKISGTLIELAIPYVLEHIIDNVVPTCTSDSDVYRVVFWGVIMILCAALALVGNIIANRMASKVSRDASMSIRHDLFNKTMHLTSYQTDSFTVPSLESRLTSDTYNVHNFLGMMQRLGVRAPILLIGGLIVTFIIDPVLTLVMLAVIPFIGGIMLYISFRGIPLYKKSQKAVDNMVRVVREDAQGIRVIKALSKKDYEKRRYDIVNQKLVAAEKKAAITMAISNPLINILLNVGIVAVILVGAFLVNNGMSEAGKIIAFISYFTLISNAMISITRVFVMYSKGSASADRIAEVIDAQQELTVQPEAKYPGLDTKDHIVFNNVDFSYGGMKKTVENISFSLKKGGSLGVIGATGSGKSTLIRLLMRMYDADAGGIYIYGRDVRTIEPGELHSMFGSVMQNDFIYADSIAENIKFGRDVSDEEMIRAAKIAQADEFISALPNKYNNPVTSKGTNISGGQKQRLLIARALLSHPDILILDDSSSALDYKTDANLRRAIADNMRDCTTITVAQRVSSVMSCDLILVIDEGKIIGRGTHEELMNNCPVYREISDSQLGGAFLD